ncbi:MULTISPECIES: TRAP transporter substrate-binding protein [unclassified Sulfitobacter]|uniref:TRAP transporter substrate-binding protein n=1 Tax=unclassified Sulfitobacter TaxID=196795 RepID=UPI0007C40D06|nr:MULTISPECIES: TRAP transporter substrate-binding protein [unclassified Sulfitobacter]KZX98864.1 C4-dicarboxylate ABC transporter substrate-binding protein [Sulfitobacter sp. HI0021]KZY01859.1 C4-dicarboxylate ABC transporter substrate-binding protein [Sulfitobacter sp. HI0027]KZZ03574.1 C4-dicarboxylate ABC transporter substrate-binding protein [Sulfitobacter sp. HI0076]
MKIFSKLLAATALSVVALSTQAAEVKVALNGADDPDTNAEAAFVHGFADALEGTEFDVKVFPSDTLGSEKERYDQVSQGLIEINLAALSTTFGQSPLAKGVQLPFFFESREELDQVMADTDMLVKLNEPLLQNGVKVVGLNYIGMDIGIHNSKKPVSKMSDLSDLRFRALNSEQLALQEALGTTGTIISWSEVANALQTGVADGYFNPPNSAIRTGHTEFLKHFTPIDLTPSTRVVLISEDWYGALPDEEKALIDTALEAGIKANREWVNAWSGEVRAKHEAAGVTITELEDGEREKMAEVARETWSASLSEAQLQQWTEAKASLGQ